MHNGQRISDSLSDRQKPIPQPLHFSTDNHDINDLKDCILESNFKDNKHKNLT